MANTFTITDERIKAQLLEWIKKAKETGKKVNGFTLERLEELYKKYSK